MHIAVLYSLPTRRSKKSAYAITDEDTVISAHEIEQALVEKGYAVTTAPLSEHDIEKTILSIKADLVFNLIEWTGVDLPLSIQAMEFLESKQIPFTGATKENFLMTTDKLLMKEALDLARISTPKWQEFQTGNEPFDRSLPFPLIIKLSQEHCSIGLDHRSIVTSEEELRARVKERLEHFHQPVFVEEFLSGREFQITVLEINGKPVMLPPSEIPYKVTGNDALLTFESRWVETHEDYHNSTVGIAQLSRSEWKELETLSKKTFTKLGFRDYARLDIRQRNNGIFSILEANSNPGLTDEDLYGMTISYRAAGMTFADFIEAIIVSCKKRFLLP